MALSGFIRINVKLFYPRKSILHAERQHGTDHPILFFYKYPVLLD